jgi:hypothetical protein
MSLYKRIGELCFKAERFCAQRHYEWWKQKNADMTVWLVYTEDGGEMTPQEIHDVEGVEPYRDDCEVEEMTLRKALETEAYICPSCYPQSVTFRDKPLIYNV